ncbi:MULTISPECIES: hypothetical protein [Haloarcula]|uniref:hypothetical protein n=1 Tax=Haloarcula TaxID=2237 RepID=UPI0023E8DA4E|nr:hypothetical protein [Halomicroarcula sp. SHR3]
MPDSSTDFQDPTVRALALVGAGLVYAVLVVPAAMASSLSQQVGALAAAGLTVAALSARDWSSTAGTADSDSRPLLSFVVSLAAIALFEFGLGTIAPGVRDAVTGTLAAVVAGAVGGLLLVGLASLVRAL